MRYLYTSRFLRAFDECTEEAQLLIEAASDGIRAYCETRKAPYGLRIKMLARRRGAKLFEARVSLDLRLLWAAERDLASFLMVGTHDEVRRFLKSSW